MFYCRVSYILSNVIAYDITGNASYMYFIHVLLTWQNNAEHRNSIAYIELKNIILRSNDVWIDVCPHWDSVLI